MSESYLNLKKKYDDLVKEHTKLKHEYSENFLIESMNDMKKTFEEKELEIKVLSSSLERLRNMNYHLCENLGAVQIMLNTIHKSMRQLINPTTSDLYQLEQKLKFVDEIIVQCLKTRDDLLFTSIL